MTALIVDDEVYSVRAIKSAVDWETLGIDQVLTAFDVRRARQLCRQEPIDIIISDIEMPNESGLEFLKWVNEEKMDAAFIFLSCHAEFTYAKEALTLKSWGYLVKPVDYRELFEEIGNCLNRLAENRREKEESRLGNYWMKHAGIVAGDWWKKQLISDGTAVAERLFSEAEEIGLPISLEPEYFLILVQVKRVQANLEHWEFSKTIRAIQNLACEIFQGDFFLNSSCVIQSHIIIICRGEERFRTARENGLRCAAECLELFQTNICLYIDEMGYCEELRKQYHILSDAAARDVLHDYGVYFIRELNSGEGETGIELPAELIGQLSSGDFEGAERAVKASLEQGMRSKRATKESLLQFSGDFVQAVSVYLHGKGIHAHDLNGVFTPEGGIRSADTVMGLLEWCLEILHQIEELAAYSEHKTRTLSISGQVRNYVQTHIGESITREQIAETVHLNPDYLNRVIKKDTGFTVMEFILRERITAAAKLLREAEFNISEAAEAVGIVNFSYFSNVFKKQMGCTPSEYRAANH